jgi:hypothetical protein
VIVQFFIIDDSLGQRLQQALPGRVQQQVRVYLLLTALTCRVLISSRLQTGSVQTRNALGTARTEQSLPAELFVITVKLSWWMAGSGFLSAGITLALSTLEAAIGLA